MYCTTANEDVFNHSARNIGYYNTYKIFYQNHKPVFFLMFFLGKTISESTFDVEAVVECCNYFSSLCYTLEGQHVPISNEAFAYTIREPLGVCGGKYCLGSSFHIFDLVNSVYRQH